MTTTVKYDLSDMMAIARLVADNAAAESSKYEVAYTARGCTLHLDIDHEVYYNVDKGDYYTPPYTEIEDEIYSVERFECLDRDGERVESDFAVGRLLEILH